jgi:hypothetical protein
MTTVVVDMEVESFEYEYEIDDDSEPEETMVAGMPASAACRPPPSGSFQSRNGILQVWSNGSRRRRRACSI